MPVLSAQTRLLALLGHPVGHSLSPAMQQAALDAAGVDAVYVALDVAPEKLADAIRGLASMGALGANVTVPHKEAAAALADERSALVERVGAANTLTFRDGRVRADNTDAPGFLASLRHDAGVELAGATYAQIGAGGAGKAMAVAAAEAGAARLLLANRSFAKAKSLAEAIWRAFPAIVVEAVPVEIAPEKFREADVVANATSLGLRPGDASPLPATAFRDGALAFDAIYPRREHGGPDALTPFLEAAKSAGARTLNGLGMLIRQGAASFELWTGRVPDIALMSAAAERALYGK